MAIGSGKYDAECEKIMKSLKAQGVVLIVIEGSKGNGASIKGSGEALLLLPDLLRMTASGCERDNRALGIAPPPRQQRRDN